MQLTPEQVAANMIAYKLLSKCRRELLTLLETVTDPVPVVAGYFDREMDKLPFAAPGGAVERLKGMEHGKRQRTFDFAGWRARLNWSKEQAQLALGVSRTYYWQLEKAGAGTRWRIGNAAGLWANGPMAWSASRNGPARMKLIK
jgi:hypothetical protein